MGLTILPFKNQRPARGPSWRAPWLGAFAGALSHFRRPRRLSITTTDLRRRHFPTSTQRLGVRFGERLRQLFRPRWLRIRTEQEPHNVSCEDIRNTLD